MATKKINEQETYLDDDDEVTEVEEEETVDRGDDLEDEDSDEEIEDTEEESEEDLAAKYEVQEEEEEESEPEEEDIRIPKARFDEVIAQRNEERERIKWYEAQLEKLLNKETETRKPPEPEYDFDTAEQDYINLILEGEIDKALSKRKEINKARDTAYTKMLQDVTEKSSSETITKAAQKADEERMQTLIETYEHKYPYLDPNSEDHNPDAVDTVNALMNTYMMSENLIKSKALTKAVDKVAKLFAKPTPTKLRVPQKKKVITQPPSTRTTGDKRERSLKGVDIMSLSERDFDKLTPREKRILRGDAI